MFKSKIQSTIIILICLAIPFVSYAAAKNIPLVIKQVQNEQQS